YGTNRLERFEFHYLFGHYWCGQSWYDDRLVTVDRPCWASPIAIGLAGRNGHFGGGARGGVFGQPEPNRDADLHVGLCFVFCHRHGPSFLGDSRRNLPTRQPS